MAQHGRTLFRDLTENQLRRGVFQDLEQSITAIGNYIDLPNKNPKPFIWTAKSHRHPGKGHPRSGRPQ
jgi:hypothetical protein